MNSVPRKPLVLLSALLVLAGTAPGRALAQAGDTTSDAIRAARGALEDWQRVRKRGRQPRARLMSARAALRYCLAADPTRPCRARARDVARAERGLRSYLGELARAHERAIVRSFLLGLDLQARLGPWLLEEERHPAALPETTAPAVPAFEVVERYLERFGPALEAMSDWTASAPGERAESPESRAKAEAARQIRLAVASYSRARRPLRRPSTASDARVASDRLEAHLALCRAAADFLEIHVQNALMRHELVRGG